jgi:hypothetical protein
MFSLSILGVRLLNAAASKGKELHSRNPQAEGMHRSTSFAPCL